MQMHGPRRLRAPVFAPFVLVAMLAWTPAASAQERLSWWALEPVVLPGALVLEAAVPPVSALVAEATPRPRLVVPPAANRPGALLPLYASFAGLQAMDVITTLHALDNGAREANPVFGGITRNPAALIAAKAGVAAGTVYLSERLWRKNRPAAVVLMLALNGAYAAIVAHNYRVGRGE